MNSSQTLLQLLQWMMPECIVIFTAFVILFLDLFMKDKNRETLAPIALVGLFVAGVAVTTLMPNTGFLMGNRFGIDSVAWWFKLIFILSTGLTLAVSIDGLDGRNTVSSMRLYARGEYTVILLFSLVGSMFLISARDLVTLYVSLETATIPLYILTAWKRDHLTSEAGLKYVVLGALSSAILLYGFSLIYGLTGHTNLETIGKMLQPSTGLWLAAAMILTGIGFKLTIVPFHVWAAEVYQGAPTPITALLSVASKAAGLALMFQVFYRMFGHQLATWAPLIALMAAFTMTVGNLVAIVQQNIKRFMAFSAISQAGYVLMGFLGTNPEGVPSMIFYMLVYIITNFTVFGVILYFSNQTGKENIRDYRGLSRTNPLIALAMMIALFSLAGIPPLAGFVGKFFLFSVASKAGFHWLVAVAAVNSTISLYYYLRIIREMYIEPVDPQAKPLLATPMQTLVISSSAIGTTLLGVFPVFYETIYSQTMNWFIPYISR